LNLMPRSHLKRQQFKKKQPYFIAAVLSIVMIVAAWGLYFQTVASARRATLANLNKQKDPLAAKKEELAGAMQGLLAEYNTATMYRGYIEDRLTWAELLNGLKRIFSDFEATQKAAFNTDTGIWVEQMVTQDPSAAAAKTGGGGTPFGANQKPVTTGPQQGTINFIFLKCRAMNLIKVAPDANVRFTASLEQTLKTNALFEAQSTQLKQLGPDASDATATNYSFEVTLQLKRPIKAY
jgi:hypothetical protein